MESLQKTEALSSALEAKTGQLAAATEDLEVVVVFVAVATMLLLLLVLPRSLCWESYLCQNIIKNPSWRRRGRALRWFHEHVAHVYVFICGRL